IDQNKEKTEADGYWEKEHRLVENLTTDPHDTCPKKQDPDHQPKQIDSLPVRGLRRSNFLFPKPPHGLNQDQGNIDDGRTKDQAKRNDEADFAVRVVWTEPADIDEIRPQPGPDESHHQGGDRDAGADNHPGAKGGG